jgi:3-dehydroquinate dehydratase-2
MKILVLNGPNLNLLGRRERDIYGEATLDQILERIEIRAREMGVEVEAYQSNEEGALVTRIGTGAAEFDGIIFNPAGYTHTSVALRDALTACELPCIEVHLSNLYKREDFRQRSLTAAACVGQISGFGGAGYVLALEGLVELLRGRTQVSSPEGGLE